MRVVAALSGGVDSSVAAARVVAAGHEVVGVHLALASDRASVRTGSRGCCTLEDARDARRVADVLGIPYYVWDLAERFRADVIDDFVAEYSAGRTPNPCLRCNEQIKFAAVLDRALALGFDAVCTGHYAQVVRGTHGAELHRAVDPAKDQSYVLGVLTQAQVEASLFPLGDTVKDDVRAEAQRLGLVTAAKPDSHDICFISDGDTQAYLREALGSRPGEILDASTGEVLGEHDGAYAYTVGQRRGLGITRPAADGAPRYVVGVDTGSNTVMVGSPRLLEVDVIECGHARWLGSAPEAVLTCEVQVRAHGAPVAATVDVQPDGSVTARLAASMRAVAPGQTMVMYEDTRVVGSATITRGRRG